MRFFVGAFVAISLTVAASVAQAATLETTNIDNWSISAHSRDRTGQFSHCATSVPYRSGILLLFSVNSNYDWSMGLVNPQWRLTQGAEFNFTYNIDRGPDHFARGVAVNSQLVNVPLQNNTSLFETFRQGHVLAVRSGSASFSFSLRNSSTALAMTLDCTRRYVARSHSPPVASSGTSQSPASNSPRFSSVEELRAEATVVLANVLSATGVQNFRVLPREEIPSDYQGWGAVWSAPGLIGAMGLLEQPSQAEQVAATLTQKEAMGCKGVFVSERIPALAGLNVARLRTGCSEGDNFVETSYSIAPRSKGGFYVFGVAGKKTDVDTARETGEKLYQAALRLPAR